jgi:hypothetical protein
MLLPHLAWTCPTLRPELAGRLENWLNCVEKQQFVRRAEATAARRRKPPSGCLPAEESRDVELVVIARMMDRRRPAMNVEALRSALGELGALIRAA